MKPIESCIHHLQQIMELFHRKRSGASSLNSDVLPAEKSIYWRDRDLNSFTNRFRFLDIGSLMMCQ